MPHSIWNSVNGCYEPEEVAVLCEKCGEPMEDESFNEELNMFICDACLDDYIPCDHCGKLYYFEEVEEIHGKYICKECLEGED